MSIRDDVRELEKYVAEHGSPARQIKGISKAQAMIASRGEMDGEDQDWANTLALTKRRIIRRMENAKKEK